MNIKYFLATVGAALACTAAMAIPANPTPVIVVQPDGTELTIRLHGDEFMSFTTTDDGVAVAKGADGSYRYAVMLDGDAVAGDVLAHDPRFRSADENEYLARLGRVRPSSTGTVRRQMRRAYEAGEISLRHRAPNYDYHNFRGLVVLVQFSDRSFSMADPVRRFGDMVTKKDYDGFTPDNGFMHEDYTGSVVDYFYDNSAGQFSPEFDIAGPVTISKSQYYVNGNDNIREVIKEAMDLLDDEVDFSLYDGDKDGTVDMFYVIFAGAGSNFTGNDERLVWPHAWNMSGNLYDGVALGRYACSTELYGPPSWNMCDGIGTICHEFSHVLGLMDEYDTDYEGSGGLSDHPGDWSLMASGGYLNNSRTPTGYSLLQRIQSGFCTPTVIDTEGEYTLDDIDKINGGFRINTSDSREYFLLENKRRSNRWNAANAGEGMLIHRVDSTNNSVWTNNRINADPSHTYYTLLRAVRKSGNAGIIDHDGDPFPGSYGVTSINYDTDPAIVAWSGKGAAFVLSDITENPDGTISFTATEQSMNEQVENFEDITTEGKYDMDVPGVYCNWSFYNAYVGETENSTKAAGIFKNGNIETSVIPGHTNAVSMCVSNNTSRPVTFNVRYNTGGNNWDYLYEPGGLAGVALSSAETRSFRFDVPADFRDDLKIQIRLANNTGDVSSPVWFDDIAVVQDHNTGVSGLVDAIDCPMTWRLDADIISFDVSDGTDLVMYDMAGCRLASATASAGRVTMPNPGKGCYIVCDGTRFIKILL